MNKNKYAKLGTMRLNQKRFNEEGTKEYFLLLKGDVDKDGNPKDDSIFPITLANGKQLNDGDILNMFSCKEEFARRVERGWMTEEKANERSAKEIFDIKINLDSVSKGSSNNGSDDEVPF